MDRFCYRVFKICVDHHLIQKGDRLIVSVSGGIDSTCLFRVLLGVQEKIAFDMRVVHFNHGLRQESEEEEQFVRQLVENAGLPIDTVKTTQFEKGKGIQNEARKWRKHHLDRLLIEHNFNKIAVGHHLNDLVETQLWRLIRGGSLFSFSPMREVHPPYIRPFLTIPKSDLEAYLKEIGQAWREDPSNLKNEYTRNVIRNQIIPLIKNVADGERFEEKMLALHEDSVRLKEQFRQTVTAETYESETISYQSLLGLPPLFALETIHQFLIFHGQNDISRSNLKEILRLVETGRGDWTIHLKNGLTVVGNKGKVRIKHEESRHA